jgi:hypothetical protein
MSMGFPSYLHESDLGSGEGGPVIFDAHNVDHAAVVGSCCDAAVVISTNNVVVLLLLLYTHHTVAIL